MAISTNQFKNGAHIEVDGTIYRIMEFQHVKPGKGGAFVRTKLRKLEDGSVIDKTFRAGEKFRPVRTETQRMQYLYDSGDAAVFMDSADYEQLELPRDGRRRGDAVGAAELRGRGAVRRRAAGGRPGAERGRDGRHRDRPGRQGRHRLGRRHQAGDAGVGRRASRCRCSSTRATGCGSTPAAASTSRGPELRAGRPMRRSDQRRAAVFALYQREVTGRPGSTRPLDDAKPFTRELVEGVESTASELDAEIARARRGWDARADRAAGEEHHARRPVRASPSRRRPRPRWRSTRRWARRSATAARTPRAS